MSKRCIECGAELEEKAMFCDECGAKQDSLEAEVVLNEQEQIAADLERTNTVGSSIRFCEMQISSCYDELKELEERASGFDMKMAIISVVLFLLGVFGVVICFKKFGIVVGIISIFIIYKIWDVLVNGILKIKNGMNKNEHEVNQKEYQEKKAELEQNMEKYSKEKEELRADIAYQRYSSLYHKRGIIPSAMINALKDGRAKTIEEAEKFADY